jgi:hypothetical protein
MMAGKRMGAQEDGPEICDVWLGVDPLTGVISAAGEEDDCDGELEPPEGAAVEAGEGEEDEGGLIGESKYISSQLSAATRPSRFAV